MATSAPTGVFLLLLKKNKFMVSPLGHLLIPVAFQPETMDEHEATVIVKISEDLKWVFPVRGITERASDRVDFNFKTKCRNVIEKTISVTLDGLENLVEDENFTHTIAIPEPEMGTFVDKSLKITPLKTILSSADEALEF
jgi:hypothetical protein